MADLYWCLYQVQMWPKTSSRTCDVETGNNCVFEVNVHNMILNL